MERLGSRAPEPDVGASDIETGSSISQRKRKPRGTLDRLKCDFCRRDKQKCEPQERQWPHKCQRCEQKGFDCSPNTRKRRAPPGAGRSTSGPAGPAVLPVSSSLVIETSRATGSPGQSAWSLTQLGNAVSLVKVLKRAVAKEHHQFETLESVFPGGFDDDLGTLSDLVQRFAEKLTDAVWLRLRSLNPISDSTMALERCILRKAICEISEQPALGVSDLAQSSSQKTSDTLCQIVDDLCLTEDTGAAFLLFESITSGITFATDDSSSEMAKMQDRAWYLYDQFKAVVPGIVKCFGASLPPSAVENPIVFDTNHYRAFSYLEDNWQRRDCLGSSVLHSLVEQIGKNTAYHNESIEISNRADLFLRIAAHAKRGFDFEDIHGRSLLHIATQYGILKLVVALLEAGVSVDERTSFYSTPLHFAAAMGHLPLCRVLLDHDANINAQDLYDRSALDYAARKGHEPVVSLLLEDERIDPNLKTQAGNTPLMSALRWGPPNVYRQFLSHTGVDYNVENDTGETALHYAVQSANVSALEALLDRCVACINLDSSDGKTALCLAAASRRTQSSDMVAVLLRADGIDASIRDRLGMTPLHHAARFGNLQACRLLAVRLDAGHFVRCKRNSFTPLDYALKGDFPEVIALLQRFEQNLRAAA